MQKEDKQTNTAYLYASEKERYDAQLRSLRTQIESKEKDINDLEKIYAKNVETKEAVSHEVEELERLGKELQMVVEKINEAISAKQLQQEVLDKTNEQVEKVEKLRKEKIQHKKQLKQEKTKLDSELNKINTTLKQMSSGEGSELIQEIDENYEEEYKKLLAKKAEIAAKNKEISKLQRKIEQCPSKTELTQYIGRFTELYEQVNRRNEEYKKYINLYNTLLMAHEQLKDQLDRACDARDGYKGCKSKKDKEVYFKTLSEIVQELNDNVAKAKQICTKIKTEKEEMQTQLDDWILKERQYFRLMSDFHKECLQNQELREKLESRSSEQASSRNSNHYLLSLIHI
eukprot:TRINITY_DN3264_c0_g1_i12.p1 TRINITY_DN3264_c0_g1~~TRINITY_DN3264_c0_g1_i12.p1  ORF type:complete len:344 (-),score=97.70 TRINITY_DN3264_c0_g1_i12:73-1104(-)